MRKEVFVEPMIWMSAFVASGSSACWVMPDIATSPRSDSKMMVPSVWMCESSESSIFMGTAASLPPTSKLAVALVQYLKMKISLNDVWNLAILFPESDIT